MAQPDQQCPERPDEQPQEQAPDGAGFALILGGDAEVIPGEPRDENEENR